MILKDDKYEPDPPVQNTNELIEQEKVCSSSATTSGCQPSSSQFLI
jgi:hypothetical protein